MFQRIENSGRQSIPIFKKGLQLERIYPFLRDKKMEKMRKLAKA